MSKRRHRKKFAGQGIKLSPPQHSATLQRSKIRQVSSTIWWAIGAVATLLTLVIGFLSFFPRVTIVSSGPPMDPQDPYSVLFNITNTTPMLITLNDVNVGVLVGQIVIGPPTPFKPRKSLPDRSYNMTSVDWEGHKLRVDETYTITLDHLFALGKEPLSKPTTLTGADIGIVVEYRPWILPWHFRKIQRFVTDRHSDGKLYWNPISLE
jgi:hypothetical protein